MALIDEELLEQLMKAVRVKSADAEEEIADLADAFRKDMEIAGVYVPAELDALSRHALKLYCKANYGYDGESEKFRAAYAALKDSMSLSGDYAKGGGPAE